MAPPAACMHCQCIMPSTAAVNCLQCEFHPWTMCDSEDCAKLPPVKHSPKKDDERRTKPDDDDADET